MADPGRTRRELLRGGAGAAGAAVGAGGPPSARDAAPLAALVRVERVVVFAYERALAGGLLSAPAGVTLTSLLGQERAHVRALSAALTALGATVPAAPTSPAAFLSELRHLHVERSPFGLRDERQELRFLIDLEGVIARHYRSAIARVAGPRLLTTAAEIMANEAQHATALAELLTPGKISRAVPVAFVAGIGG